MSLPVDLVEGTAAGVHGAATLLLEHLYTLLTGKRSAGWYSSSSRPARFRWLNRLHAVGWDQMRIDFVTSTAAIKNVWLWAAGECACTFPIFVIKPPPLVALAHGAVVVRVEHAVIDPDALATSALGLAALGGAGGAAGGSTGDRAIAAALKASAAIQFGTVQTTAVAESALEVRRRLAGASVGTGGSRASG
jgi:hypothetical protein